MFQSTKFVDAYALEKDTHPFRIYMERHSVLKQLGSVEGLNILDIACGAGNYSRLLYQLGAKSIVGVDASKQMVATAKKSTEAHLPIQYFHDFGETFRATKTFDFVFHAYFLNYAFSLNNLQKMCDSLYANLCQGGRMLGIVSMLGGSPSGAVTCCDFYTDFETPPEEGDLYLIKVKNQAEDIPNYHWRQETYQQKLESAGFREIQWHLPMYEPSNLLTDSQWQQLVDYPVFLAVTATK